MNIYAISINDNTDEVTIAKWLTYLTPERQERLHKFRFREDFLQSLMGEAMLRIIVGEKVGVAPGKLEIRHKDGEKPFFSAYPEIYFNISHSGEWAVCAIGDDEVGIDIEAVGDKDINPSLIRKVLTENEQKYLNTLSDELKITAFYQFWTMKEAYAKCIGRGLGLAFNKIDINIGQNTVSLISENQKWQGKIKPLDFRDNYILSVCTAKADEEIILNKFIGAAHSATCRLI